MVKFNSIIYFNFYLAIIISRINALYEDDLKKVIALYTLRQLDLMIIILRLELNLLGFYHLITHALFKSFIFMQGLLFN
jgi:NADH:ubiquinone oxidoreductase subunit 5 (subunit L)/multisubunit Na+/H+ antiporter MnhA subunit